MKLVTYEGSGNRDETVLYTASGVRLNLGAPTVVEDDDVPDVKSPELKGHKLGVETLTKQSAGDAKVGDVIRKQEADTPAGGES